MTTWYTPLTRAFAMTLAAIALVTLPLSDNGHAMADDDDKRRITISATGSVDAEPDMVRFSTGVVTQGDTAKAALDENSKRMRNVIDGLKALGISAKDIQTSAFNINPRYARRKTGQSEIDGFEVRNTLMVLIRDPDALGGVLDKAATLGANQFGGIDFIVSETDTLLDKARTNAIKAAKRKAALYVEAAGARLGRVLRIREGGRASGPRPMMKGRAMVAESAPIESGTTTVSISVSVTWALID